MDETEKQLSSEPRQESTAAGQKENLENLEDVVLDAQRHAPGSKEQNDLVTRLIGELHKPGKLQKPKNPYQLSSNSFNEIHEVAKQEFHLELVEQIQAKKYDPEKGEVLNWARFHQKKMFSLPLHILKLGQTRKIIWAMLIQTEYLVIKLKTWNKALLVTMQL
jgi:hypothetical protein